MFWPVFLFDIRRMPRVKELLHTGIRYGITLLKISKTRRPISIVVGIEEKLFFNKIIEAEL